MTGRRSHGRLSALNGVVHQGMLSQAPHPGRHMPGGHHEGSVLESGEWVMSTFRCAANVAER